MRPCFCSWPCWSVPLRIFWPRSVATGMMARRNTVIQTTRMMNHSQRAVHTVLNDQASSPLHCGTLFGHCVPLFAAVPHTVRHVIQGVRKRVSLEHTGGAQLSEGDGECWRSYIYISDKRGRRDFRGESGGGELGGGRLGRWPLCGLYLPPLTLHVCTAIHCD